MGFDQIKNRIRRPTVDVHVHLDYSAYEEVERIHREWQAAVNQEKAEGQDLADRSPQLARDLMEAQARWRESATRFTFQALPGAAFDALAREFPPSEEQFAEWAERVKSMPFEEAPTIDAEAMAPVLIARCLTAIDGEEAQWSDEDGVELWEELHEGARADLIEAVWAVNRRRSDRPTFGTGTAMTGSSGPASIMSLLEASPSPSSKAE